LKDLNCVQVLQLKMGVAPHKSFAFLYKIWCLDSLQAIIYFGVVIIIDRRFEFTNIIAHMHLLRLNIFIAPIIVQRISVTK